jgi:hypothetical protein
MRDSGLVECVGLLAWKSNPWSSTEDVGNQVWAHDAEIVQLNEEHCVTISSFGTTHTYVTEQLTEREDVIERNVYVGGQEWPPVRVSQHVGRPIKSLQATLWGAFWCVK